MRFKLAAVITLGAGLAAADTPEICAGVENDIARLSCFDRVADATPPIEAVTPEWAVRSEEDPITDAIRTTISVNALGRQACSVSRDILRLELICAEHTDTWFVRIRQNCHLGIDKEFRFLTRTDKTEAISETFSPAAGRSDIQMSVAPAARLITRLINSERFLVRIEPSSEYPEAIEFPTKGLAAALTESGAGCKL